MWWYRAHYESMRSQHFRPTINHDFPPRNLYCSCERTVNIRPRFLTFVAASNDVDLMTLHALLPADRSATIMLSSKCADFSFIHIGRLAHG